MGILNRTLDHSQRLTPLNFSLGNAAFSQGETGVLVYVPFPCNIHSINLSTISLDGTPFLQLNVSRFIVGSGVTTWILGSTFALVAFGTSGVLPSGVSLPALGSTTLRLMANDIIGYQVGTGSTLAAFGVAGCAVVLPLQDVKSYLGGLA